MKHQHKSVEEDVIGSTDDGFRTIERCSCGSETETPRSGTRRRWSLPEDGVFFANPACPQCGAPAGVGGNAAIICRRCDFSGRKA